jgi:hypothetical protein
VKGLDTVSVVGWSAWIAFFVIWEGKGLISKKKGDTLSELIWSIFATSRLNVPVTGWVRLRRFLLLAGMAWLTVHFATGGAWA